MAIAYRYNEFQSFVATRSFDLGSTGIKLTRGMPILFDGSTADVGGAKFPIPTLRGAVTRGWIVPEEDFDEDDDEEQERVSANIQFRPAQQAGDPRTNRPGTAVEADERIVMTRGGRAAEAQQRTAASHAARHGSPRRTPQVEAVDQGGIMVRSLSTPARSVTEVTSSSVGSAIEAAKKVKIEGGRGRSQEEYLAQLSPEEREEYLSRKEALRAEKNLGAHAPPPVVAPRVKTAKRQTADGVTSRATVTTGTEIYDAGGSAGEADQSVTVVEGMAFRNTNGPKRAYKREGEVSAAPAAKVAVSSDARRRLALRLCPDFPAAYDFDGPLKRKVALLRLNFEDRSDVLNAVFAAESDEFKNILLAEFPEAFALVLL
jgi:hypothetical protein